MDRARQPSGKDFERAILYLALKYPQKAGTIFQSLSLQAFTDALYKEIFKQAYTIFKSRQSLSYLSLQQALEESGFSPPKPLKVLLKFGLKDRPSLNDLPGIIAKLKELWGLRRLEELTTGIAFDVRSAEGKPITELLTDLVDEAFKIETQVTEVRDDSHLYSGDIYRRRRAQGLRRKRKAKRLLSGWKDLNKFLANGFSPGGQTILAGRPGIGKSAVKTNMIKDFCERGYRVLSISPEMGVEGDGDRLDALVAKISLTDLSKYRYWPELDPRHKKLKQAVKTQSQWPYHVYGNKRVGVSTVANLLNRLERQGQKVDIVFIDLFDRLSDVQVTKQKNYQVGIVLNEFAALAQRYQVHFIHLVQIHRLGRQASAQRYKPTMEDLKGSGSFEEFADMVLLLWREGYYNKAVTDDRLEICLAKQRGGIGGDHLWIPFLLQKEIMFVGSLMEEDRDENADPHSSAGSKGTVERVEDEGTPW